MALVKFSDYNGSLIAQEALSSVLEIGLGAYAKSLGYMIDISPIMNPTPKGMIENTPDKHCITFSRSVPVDENFGNDDTVIEHFRNGDFNFTVVFPYVSDQIRNTWIDQETKIRWYNHSFKMVVSRGQAEDDEAYALKMTKAIYDALGFKE